MQWGCCRTGRKYPNRPRVRAAVPGSARPAPSSSSQHAPSQVAQNTGRGTSSEVSCSMFWLCERVTGVVTERARRRALGRPLEPVLCTIGVCSADERGAGPSPVARKGLRDGCSARRLVVNLCLPGAAPMSWLLSICRYGSAPELLFSDRGPNVGSGARSRTNLPTMQTCQ
jgi:hypothetical protein